MSEETVRGQVVQVIPPGKKDEYFLPRDLRKGSKGKTIVEVDESRSSLLQRLKRIFSVADTKTLIMDSPNVEKGDRVNYPVEEVVVEKEVGFKVDGTGSVIRSE